MPISPGAQPRRRPSDRPAGSLGLVVNGTLVFVHVLAAQNLDACHVASQRSLVKFVRVQFTRLDRFAKAAETNKTRHVWWHDVIFRCWLCCGIIQLELFAGDSAPVGA